MTAIDSDGALRLLDTLDHQPNSPILSFPDHLVCPHDDRTILPRKVACRTVGEYNNIGSIIQINLVDN